MISLRNRAPLTLALVFWFGLETPAQVQPASPTKTQVVMLGTGTPGPDPDRSGPATAIIANGAAYLVDAGTGIVRRAASARRKGMEALEPTALRISFLTHLHADHTLGLADLMLTPWIMGREEPLKLYGPPGTRAMAERILQAYEVDIRHQRKVWNTRTGRGTKSRFMRSRPAWSTKTRMSPCQLSIRITDPSAHMVIGL